MQTQQVTHFFLGANSADGFYSLYDGLVDQERGEFLWVIKGGPGCGKSSFMKKLGAAAELAGQEVEYIHCSGDPDSLDAVRFPELGIAYVDGTAPHIMEPKYPAASGLYLDLGAFYAAGKLENRLADMVKLGQRYRAQYACIYDALAAAAAMEPQHLPGLYLPGEKKSVENRALACIHRECGRRTGEKGRCTRRFLSAISCKGTIFRDDSLLQLCPRVYLLEDMCGLADSYLAAAERAALERGQEILLCLDPLCPQRREALLFPELGLAFLADRGRHPADMPIYRRIHLDAMVDPERLRALRGRLRERARLSAALRRDAEMLLAEAKAMHDDLERFYNPHVDFDGIYALAREHMDWLLGKTE